MRFFVDFSHSDHLDAVSDMFTGLAQLWATGSGCSENHKNMATSVIHNKKRNTKGHL